MNKSTKSILQFIVLLGIGLLLVWLSFRQVAPQKDNIIKAFQNADYTWVILSIIVSFFSHFFRAYRWNQLLNPLGYNVTLFNGVSHVFVGYLANYGIPRMGEVTRCTLAAKYDKVPFEIGFGTVITERIVDFFLLILIFILTLIFQFSKLYDLANELIFSPLKSKLSGLSENPIKLILLIAVIIVLIGAFFFFRKKVSGLLRGKFGNVLKGLGEGIGSIRKMKNPVQFIILSIVIWACYYYSLLLCFFAIEGTSDLGHGAALTVLLFGTFGVVFSPGGLGAYPLIVGGILTSTYGIDEVSSFALPWLTWTSQFVLIIAIGVISLILLPIINSKKNVVSQ